MTHPVSNSGIDRLLDAAGSGDRVLIECITDIGVAPVARTVLAEILDRVDLRGCPPADILFRLHTADADAEVAIRVEDAKAVFTDPRPGAAVTIEQSLPEVVRTVYGPRGGASSATRILRWAQGDAPGWFGLPQDVFETIRRLLDSIDHGYRPGLAELCVRHGSDKWGTHQYPQWYERHFEPIRDRRLTILEIGVGGYQDSARGGESLRMWKNYFPRAAVYGLDIFDKTSMSGPRTTVLQGDQSSPEDLRRVLAATGPLDVVIDDGSHRSEHVKASFAMLFPALRENGIYVIEDLQTSYWPGFGGRPPGQAGIPTSMDYLKTLVDGLNYEEITGRRPSNTDTNIRGLHFYHNLAMIEKGANRDGGGPQWMRGD